MNLSDLNPDEVRMITFLDRHSIKVLMEGNREFTFEYGDRDAMDRALSTWSKIKSKGPSEGPESQLSAGSEL